MESNALNPYPDSSPPPDEQRMLQAPSRWLVIIGVFLLVFGVTALFGAKPAYRWFKSQRARVFTERGVNQMAAGNLDGAGNNLRIALGLAPNDPGVLRLAARYCARRGMTEGLNYWQLLLAQPAATREDLLEYLDLALHLNRVDLTGPHLHDLLKKSPRDRQILRRILQHFRQSNRPAAAILAGREWLLTDPTDDEAQYFLGILLRENGTNFSQVREGRGLIWSLALGNGRFADGAIEQLVPDRGLTRAENEVLLKRLSARSTNGVHNMLCIATVRLRLDPESATAIAHELVRDVPTGAPDSQVALIGNWLTEHRQAEAALALLPLESCRTNPALLSIRLRAVAELGRWDEIGPYLDGTNDAVIPRTLKHCFLAQRDYKLGRLQNVPGHFDNALAACSNRLSEIEFVGAFAESLHQPMSAVAAYERLLAVPPLALDAARRILTLLAPLDDLRAERDTLRKLTTLLPFEPNILVEETYVSLVLGERRPEARDAMAGLLKKDPTNIMARCTLALAELRAGNAPTALSVLEGVEIDWSTAIPRLQAVYTAALGATQQREAARQFARRVDRSRLKTEERQLVDPWL